MSKILFGVLAVIVITTSAIILNSQNRGAVVKPDVVTSSSSVAASNSLFNIVSSSALTVVSLINSSSVNKVENVEVKSSVVTQNNDTANDLGLNPIQDIPNVTKLSTDKSIYHQYIKDYLACPTKFYQPLNGGYIYDGETDYKYLCIPQDEADKCQIKTLIYGTRDRVGYEIAYLKPYVSSQKNFQINENTIEREIIKQDKYYCLPSWEGQASVTLPGNYYSGYFPEALDSKLPKYFTIPKVIIPKSRIPGVSAQVSFAAIPLTSFTQEDQEYISKNFKTN
jgi:hypothetical protein